ncbi:MAG: SURF1 family protein [Steroidobacteraceae bacterium]
MRIDLGKRIFSPSLAMTVLTIAAVALFIALGRWQWHRGEYHRALRDQFAQQDRPAVEIGTRSLASLPRFSRVLLRGRYVPRQFVLDNMSHNGQPGYEVLTVFALADGREVLVNRGWLQASGYRDRLPGIDLPLQLTTAAIITGRLTDLPVAALESGRAPPTLDARWPKLTSFPRWLELEAAAGHALERQQVLLDASQPGGFLREFRPPGIDPERNFSYAIQWWAFALLAIVLYLVLNLRKVTR